MRYSQYPEYKNTNVMWMPQIPSHWSQRRLKMVATFAYGGSLSVDARMPGDIPVYGSNGVVGTHDISNTDKPCIIIGRKGSSGKLVYSNVAGFAIDTTFFIDKRTTDAELKWLYYVLQCLKLDEVSKDSAVPGLAREDAYQYIIPWTEIEEQKKIANFLDYKTKQIDQLIEKKKALIEKLNEQRIAVITRAVTRGLDETVPMKDSGVDWLGQVPEHWDVRGLKFCFDFLNNKRIPLSAEERTGMAKNYPYYGASGVIDYVEDYIFDEPTVLVAEDGANLLSRSTPLSFIADGKYWVNNHAHILRPVEGSFDYWADFLCTIEFDPWITGSAQPKLTKDNLGTIQLPHPPIDEQYKIAKFINQEKLRIDPMIESVSIAVERLEEYRIALIMAAVTGKIDVHNVSLLTLEK